MVKMVGTQLCCLNGLPIFFAFLSTLFIMPAGLHPCTTNPSRHVIMASQSDRAVLFLCLGNICRYDFDRCGRLILTSLTLSHPHSLHAGRPQPKRSSRRPSRRTTPRRGTRSTRVGRGAGQVGTLLTETPCPSHPLTPSLAYDLTHSRSRSQGGISPAAFRITRATPQTTE